MADPDSSQNHIPAPTAGRSTGRHLVDELIYCPVCNYNLTGVLSGRCPECGSAFHREALFAAQRASDITLIPWDDPDPMPLLSRLSQTLRVSLFDPRRFAFAFSVVPQRTRAVQFAGLVLILTWPALAAPVGVGWLMAARMPRSVMFARLGDILGIGLIASFLLTVFIGLMIPLFAGVLYVLCTHYDGQPHFKPWLSISAYATAHFLLAPVSLPLMFVFTLFSGGEALLAYGAAMSVVILGCGLLAVFTLRGVISLRTAPGPGPRLAVVLLFLLCLGLGLFGTGMAMYLASEVWYAM